MYPTTLNEMFLDTVENRRRRDCLSHKVNTSYRDISTEQVARDVGNVRTWLISQGLNKGDKVAILSYNRPEWAIIDYAILTAGCVTVPIYTTLTADQIGYILRDADVKIIFVENVEYYNKVKGIKTPLPELKGIVSIDDPNSAGINTLSKIINEERGNATVNRPPANVSPNDLATLIYTSGTTGEPKGVMLTHRNILSNVLSISDIFNFSAEDVTLSFLPLSHVFQRVVDYALFYTGASIAYPENIGKVVENIKEVAPTIIAAVPRFYEKLYSRIMDEIAGAGTLKRTMFKWAKNCGERHYQNPSFLNNIRFTLASILVLNKLKGTFGGRIRFFISGSAPLSKDIVAFFFAIGMPILEGYGLTETSPVVSVNTETDFRIGTVGKPIPNVTIHIAEDGEVLVQGPNVMAGYYKRQEETETTIKNGWLYTGDIGEVDKDGFLKITDRKKDLIKTSGGKFIAPQPIETVLKMSQYISTAVVVGNNRKFVSALIIPNFSRVSSHSKSELEQIIENEIEKVNANLSQFETIKKFILLENDFTIECGELTPTMKPKRKFIDEKYKKLIDTLYSD